MSNQPTLVVLGASGDLAARLLFPALLSLEHRERLEDLRIIGYARQDWTDEQFHENLRAAIDRSGAELRREVPRQVHRPHRVPRRRPVGRVAARAERRARRPRDLLPRAAARRVRRRGRDDREGRPRRRDQRLAPARDREAVRHRSRRARSRSTSSCTRVGAKNQIFRIDHFLGKETVQNILVFRFANRFVEPVLRADHVDEIQITVGRDARRRGSLALLRRHRRAARHDPEPPRADDDVRDDGAAGAVGRGDDPRPQGRGAEGGARASIPRPTRCAGSTPPVSWRASRASAYRAEPGVDPDVAHRHVRRAAPAPRHVAVGRRADPVAFGQAARGEGARGRVPLQGAADAPVPAHAARAQRPELARVPHEPDGVHRARHAHQAARSRSRSARVDPARRVHRPRTTTRRRRTSSCCSTC